MNSILLNSKNGLNKNGEWGIFVSFVFLFSQHFLFIMKTNVNKKETLFLENENSSKHTQNEIIVPQRMFGCVTMMEYSYKCMKLYVSTHFQLILSQIFW